MSLVDSTYHARSNSNPQKFKASSWSWSVMGYIRPLATFELFKDFNSHLLQEFSSVQSNSTPLWMMYQYRLKLTDLNFEMVVMFEFWFFHEMAVKRAPLVKFIHNFVRNLYIYYTSYCTCALLGNVLYTHTTVIDRLV